MKNETDSNRTRDLLGCSAVPSIANMAAIGNVEVMVDNLNVHRRCACVSTSFKEGNSKTHNCTINVKQ